MTIFLLSYPWSPASSIAYAVGAVPCMQSLWPLPTCSVAVCATQAAWQEDDDNLMLLRRRSVSDARRPSSQCRRVESNCHWSFRSTTVLRYPVSYRASVPSLQAIPTRTLLKNERSLHILPQLVGAPVQPLLYSAGAQAPCYGLRNILLLRDSRESEVGYEAVSSISSERAWCSVPIVKHWSQSPKLGGYPT